MFNKNTAFLLIGLLALLILLLTILFFIKNTTNKIQTAPTPIIIFSPSPTPFSQQQNSLQQQTQADINYTEAQNKVLQEYPWYNKLPLQTNNYFVLFDTQKKVIRAKIYPQKSSSISIDSQVKSYQQDITDKLKQIGIDTSLYPVQWSINPE